MKLQDLIDALESAPRQGFVEDAPEGSRYIQISDTMVAAIVEFLKNEVVQISTLKRVGGYQPSIATVGTISPPPDE